MCHVKVVEYSNQFETCLLLLVRQSTSWCCINGCLGSQGSVAGIDESSSKDLVHEGKVSVQCPCYSWFVLDCVRSCALGMQCRGFVDIVSCASCASIISRQAALLFREQADGRVADPSSVNIQYTILMPRIAH